MAKRNPFDIEAMSLEELDALSTALEAEREAIRARLIPINARRTQLNVEREQAARHPNRDLDQNIGRANGHT